MSCAQQPSQGAIEADIAPLKASINQLLNWFVSGLITILAIIPATAIRA